MQFPDLAKKSFEVLVPFVTMHNQCEQSFSVIIINKKQAAQSLGRFPHNVRLALSKREPRIKELAASKQARVSH